MEVCQNERHTSFYLQSMIIKSVFSLKLKYIKEKRSHRITTGDLFWALCPFSNQEYIYYKPII